jgi:CubicO group peptidase (beta-lactamase class C family)
MSLSIRGEESVDVSGVSTRRRSEPGRTGGSGAVCLMAGMLAALCCLAVPVGAASLSDRAALDAFIKAGRETNGFKTMGVLLCDAHGTFYTISLGGDEESSRHLLASATKLASATAVMSVVDDGTLSLDDPIGKYLPQFGPNRRGITIRQLLSQTHGLPGSNAAIAPPQVDNGLTLAQAVDRIALDDTLVFPPGSKHTYMPAVSYHIAGRIAEIVTGKTWAQLFEERVGGPLEMTGFSYGDTPNPRIGGGAKCALQDYGNLVQMHLAGGVFKGRRVLSAASVAEMQKDQLHGVPFTPARAVPRLRSHLVVQQARRYGAAAAVVRTRCVGRYTVDRPRAGVRRLPARGGADGHARPGRGLLPGAGGRGGAAAGAGGELRGCQW